MLHFAPYRGREQQAVTALQNKQGSASGFVTKLSSELTRSIEKLHFAQRSVTPLSEKLSVPRAFTRTCRPETSSPTSATTVSNVTSTNITGKMEFTTPRRVTLSLSTATLSPLVCAMNVVQPLESPDLTLLVRPPVGPEEAKITRAHGTVLPNLLLPVSPKNPITSLPDTFPSTLVPLVTLGHLPVNLLISLEMAHPLSSMALTTHRPTGNVPMEVHVKLTPPQLGYKLPLPEKHRHLSSQISFVTPSENLASLNPNAHLLLIPSFPVLVNRPVT